MPDPVTIRTEGSPALSADNIAFLEANPGEEATEEELLLAGKYKSVEELERGYKELQNKLSQGRQEPDEATEEVEEGEAQLEPESRSAKEIYGDLVGSRLEEAEIDFSDMNSRWQQSGELDADDYSQLDQAGFNKEMVDAYLAGLSYQAAKDSALTMQQVNEVKASVGGEAEYSAMIEWASKNLSKEEVEAFDSIVNTQPLSTVKLATAGIYSRYTGANGREPKLIGGRTPRSDGDVFESTAQVVEAMSDPKYHKDPAYRKKVEAKLSRSKVF
jgi:hypothetical protein